MIGIIILVVIIILVGGIAIIARAKGMWCFGGKSGLLNVDLSQTLPVTNLTKFAATNILLRHGTTTTFSLHHYHQCTFPWEKFSPHDLLDPEPFSIQ